MILGTKTRYAVMALVDLAQSAEDKPVSLADIAARQEISLAYLEQIFPKLKKAQLVRAVRGPGGGYQLTRSADSISVLEIVQAVDESTKMTRCEKKHVQQGRGCMSTRAQCLTHALWDGLELQIQNYFRTIRLSDVSHKHATTV
jgi:Rrf2 family iron-sulfur cluster assembly transcriptional regulator